MTGRGLEDLELSQCKSWGIEQTPDTGSDCVAEDVQSHMGSSSQEPAKATCGRAQTGGKKGTNA